MKRVGLGSIFMIVTAALLGCSFFTNLAGQGSAPAPSVAAPTETTAAAEITDQPQVQATETTAPVETNPEPTASPTLEPTAEPTIEPTATLEPTPTQPAGIVEEFNGLLTDWLDPYVVTTQAKPNQFYSTVKMDRTVMVVNLADKETYLYNYHQMDMPADVEIKTFYQSTGAMENGIVVVCRANADRSAWYEFEVSSQGIWKIFRYDKARKANQGLNPYLELKRGSIQREALYPTRENALTLRCEGNTFSMDFNEGRQQISVSDETEGAFTEGGGVGLGVKSFGALPVTIRFDYFYATPIE